ncbi:MAG: transcriptional repressor [Deltaproteobacteria bacterium]|nr:MAG: transcriptional repressor [Deltaproteobacteria bacterium]
MADPQKRLEQMIRRLKEKGGRLTPQRLAMLRIIAESKGHPSAEQIFEQIKADFPTTSLATIYKTLSLLKDLGEVLELNLAGVGSRFDGNKPYPHPHVICTKCGQIIDPEFEPMAGISREIARQTGYKITHEQLNFFGLCPKCQQEGQAPE